MKFFTQVTFSIKNLAAALLLFLVGQVAVGQTIASEGFNNTSSLFTVSGGAYYTGNSAGVSSDLPANSPFAAEGTHSYGVTNGTATLTSNSINTSSYTGISVSMRLASFSFGSPGNGADGTDIVTVAVSPDGGTTYYNTVTVAGNSNAVWSYAGGTANASTAYDGNTTAVAFAPTGGGTTPRTTDGYSTITITGVPAVSALRVRITMLNNATSERWVLDDFKITGTLVAAAVPVVTGGNVTGTVGTVLTNYQIIATNSPTAYAVASGTLPAGLSLATGTGIISGTPTAAGTSSVTVTATNGTGTSSPAATLNFDIAKANQTITFNALSNKQYGDATFTLGGTTTSPLTVTYGSSNTNVATVLGNVVTVVGVGTTTITASQAGDANYNVATNVLRSLIVDPKSITVGGLTGNSKTYDATTAATVSGAALPNGVLVADIANVTLAGTASYTFATATVGTAKVISVSGLSLTGSASANYTLAAATGLTANITAKTITVTGVTAQDRAYNGTTVATVSGGTFTGVETADTANVSISTTGTFASANVGTGIGVTVTLTGSASTNYSLTQPGITANITKANQTITFNALLALNTGSAAVNLTTYASTTSGLTLTYASSNPLVVSVSGTTLTVVGVGTATITASQAGDSNYNAATNATQNVTVLSAPVVLSEWALVSDVLPSNVATNVTASNFTKTANLGLSTSGFGPSASGYFADSWPTATSIDLTKYFEITVNPNTNYELLIDELQFSERRSNTGIRTYQVRYSLDDFNTFTTIATVSVPDDANERTGNIGNLNVAVPEGQTLKFRFYGYGTEAAGGTWRINDATLKVTGFVVTKRVIWNGSVWSNSNVGPNADIEAAIQGVYNTQTNGVFTAKKITLTSGSFTVNSGTNITVVGAVINSLTADKFVVENNANLLQKGTVNSNSGNITVKRNSAAIKRLDYTLWSSPVTGQGLYAFSKTTLPNRFYVYDSTNDVYSNAVGFNLENLQYPSPLVMPNGVNGNDVANVTFGAATGYLIRTPYNHQTAPIPYEGTFTGVPHNGIVTVTTTSGLYYAVGNPYPSTISANTFISNNTIGNSASVAGDGLYFWRKTNNVNQTANPSSSYATYTNAGGTASGGDLSAMPIKPNGVIQVGEGFIVRATSGALTFNNGQRIANNDNQFLRNANTERHRIWLNLSDGVANVNQMLVSYMTGATQDVDAAIDARYFNDSPTALNSLLNNEEFTIQGRSLPFDTSDVVPLAFKAANAGNYTITLNDVDGLFTAGAQIVYLKDSQTGTYHNLNGGAYTFASAVGTFNNRFEIVYQNQLSSPVFTANTVVIYNQNNEFVIHSGSVTMASVKVFDIRGRLLQEKTGINSSQAIIGGGQSNQVLLVQITSEDGITVTKKVMR